MARNYWQLVHPERILLIAVLFCVLTCGVAFLLFRAGAYRLATLFTVSIAVVILTRGGPIVRSLGGLAAWLAVLLVIGLAWFVARRFGDHPAIEMTVVVLAVALGSGPLILGYNALSTFGESDLTPARPLEIELAERPDIYLVVVDGYPGSIGMESAVGLPGTDVASALESREFLVPKASWSSYWATDLAVPSLLEMDYIGEGTNLSNATTEALHDVIGGENATVDFLQGNGYELVMIESGWAGSECGVEFDRCTESAFLDDLVFMTLWDGLWGGPVLNGNGHAYTAGTKSTMDALRDLAVREAERDSPRFVFAHLVAPHPPFFLDSNCDVVVEENRLSDSFYQAGVPDQVREQMFVDQVSCVDSFLVEFADLVDRDDVVIFVADHGVDRYQRFAGESALEDSDVEERMNVLVAGRISEQCELSDPLMTVNLMREVFDCYALSEVPKLEPRMFLPTGEMESESLSELLRS